MEELRESNSAPVWLEEEPEIVALLNAALDRYDAQPGASRQRDVSLKVSRFLPSLARTDAAADQLWSFVQALEAMGVLRIRRGRRGPYDPDWTDARVVFSPSVEPRLRAWLARAPAAPELERWRAAVLAHADLFPGGCAALLARRIVIPGRTPEEVANAFASISAVRGPVTLRQLSALAFWGDSKVLDDRGDLIAALFPQLEIRTRAIVVAVYLPEQYDEVLFIENQDTYAEACAGRPEATRGIARVFAAGFRGAAERIRTPEGALLHFAGADAPHVRDRFSAWWFGREARDLRCWFWGDLDFAGMQILKALRMRFGEVRAWAPGYAPMLEALRSRGEVGRPEGVHLRGQIDPGETGCPYADEHLLPAIRAHGPLDQESLVDL
ncbi:MAG TPA: hypothetical protein VF193_13175 [Steroidobacter sp.]